LHSAHKSAPRLELAGISKRFGNVVALDNVSLTASPGSIHALLGENGAGKTTLMRIAFGMIPPDSGTIAVNGRTTKLESSRMAIAAGIGMVHQHFSLVPAMTTAENVALGGAGRLRISDVVSRMEQIGRDTGLRVDPTLKVSALGAADRQKLEIIRTLSHDAQILILDEPTAVLTLKDVAELFSQLRTFADNGGTVILITHKLRDALAHADHVTVLRRGRSVLSSPMSGLGETELSAAMLGEARDATRSPDSRGAPGNVVLSLRNVVLRKSGNQSPVDLEIRRGEIVGVAALDNRAQSLLSLCAGRTRAASGNVLLPERIGYVPENRLDHALIPGFSLAENFALRSAGSRAGLIDWSDITAMTKSIMESFDVRAEGPGSRASQLSGGNQQRFVLGREMQGTVDLLVLENPTQGLDVSATAAVHDRVRQAAAEGTSVLIYSSDLDEIAELSDRVVVLQSAGIRHSAADRDIIGGLLLETTTSSNG
jgi:simple sugar transport system ATP-binding protein